MKIISGAILMLCLFTINPTAAFAQADAQGLCEVVLFSGETFEGMLENLSEKKGAIDKVKVRDNKGKKHTFLSSEVSQLKVQAVNLLTQRFEEVTYEHPEVLPHNVKYKGLLKLLRSTDNETIKVYSYEHGFKPYPKKWLHLVDGGVDIGM